VTRIAIRRDSQWVWRTEKAPAVHLCARVIYVRGRTVVVAYPCGMQVTWDRDIFLTWWEPKPDWRSDADWEVYWNCVARLEAPTMPARSPVDAPEGPARATAAKRSRRATGSTRGAGRHVVVSGT
jgi:hypothetical protein